MRDHLSLLSKNFERYFPSTKDLRTGSLVSKPGESSISVQEDQLVEIANDGSLKAIRSTQ